MKYDINLSNAFAFDSSRGFTFDIDAPLSNILTINGTDYIPYYLDMDRIGQNKGANSFVLKLCEAQTFDEDNGYPEEADLVIKICRFWKATFNEHDRSKRFQREILALCDCKVEELPNVIEIVNHGLIDIPRKGGGRSFHRYYTMPCADTDLEGYLSEKRLSLVDRLGLCLEIAESLKQLWSKKYYHRDIKPDNILFIGNTWMIADLGIIENRDEDQSLDESGEWIGPRGWMSPEALNKFLAESKPWGGLHDCAIEHQSDIFQLGLVFWYILQGNSPRGGLRRTDFKWRNERVYQIVRTMLNNSKRYRYKEIEDVIFLLKKEYSIEYSRGHALHIY